MSLFFVFNFPYPSLTIDLGVKALPSSRYVVNIVVFSGEDEQMASLLLITTSCLECSFWQIDFVKQR
jgi:hypothetical protein